MIPWGGSCIQPTDRSAIHTAASTRRHSRPTNQLLNLETARARSYSQASEEQDECLEHPAPITLYYAEKMTITQPKLKLELGLSLAKIFGICLFVGVVVMYTLTFTCVHR